MWTPLSWTAQGTCILEFVWKCCVPLNPVWLMIIIPTKWLFHWEYTPFSDIPIYIYIYIHKTILIGIYIYALGNIYLQTQIYHIQLKAVQPCPCRSSLRPAAMPAMPALRAPWNDGPTDSLCTLLLPHWRWEWRSPTPESLAHFLKPSMRDLPWINVNIYI